MTKEHMIETLISDDMDTIFQNDELGNRYFLYQILRNGWKGYASMTDKELEDEYKDRDFPEEEQ